MSLRDVVLNSFYLTVRPIEGKLDKMPCAMRSPVKGGLAH